MYVYRDNNGKKEFFVLHRKRRDNVILTGHVEYETLKQTAKRETIEELGIEPISVIDLDISVDVKMQERGENIISTEHAFLIQIPNKDVYFLEGDEKHKWHSLEKLYNILTYPNQKEPLSKIKK